MKISKIAFVLGLALIPLSALADPIPGLQDAIKDQITSSTTAINSCTDFASVSVEQEWYFRRIWLRFRPSVKISLAGIANLQFIPEVEFLVEKKLPDGWKTYSP